MRVESDAKRPLFVLVWARVHACTIDTLCLDRNIEFETQGGGNRRSGGAMQTGCEGRIINIEKKQPKILQILQKPRREEESQQRSHGSSMDPLLSAARDSNALRGLSCHQLECAPEHRRVLQNMPTAVRS